ncbi:hypothetical protein A1O7_07298 [Cladophialophora yegresii CBS 114405]|uniref:Seipin n=1 Tax=Cladophialophora yegresii CBS 114405 TaxID=1182544 RepID=W9WEK0_9EURO|nr:uncharacterized protein A1O7_07298 [Cladophialophora yegresii CBS 114405]EXJ56954.1 hypothetical protein A1O7_07298 [Cladophialophora yegresii CBS 114405]
MADATYQNKTYNYDYDEEGDSLTRRAIQLALAPLRILTSRAAIKVYLAALLFLATSAVLLTVSSSAYAVFYYNYIPQINLERPLYLQYDAAAPKASHVDHEHRSAHPHATVALDTAALIAHQAYDISVILEMPRCATNLNAGNFMLDLSLLASGDPDAGAHATPPADTYDSDILHRSRRPAIVPFASPLPALARTLVQLPLHILGLRGDPDRSTLVVPMFEMLVFDGRRPRGSGRSTGNIIPTHAKVEVQSREPLRVYSAKLVFRAQFQGLRYFVYNYRGLSFVVFSALFYMVAVTSLLLGWALIAHFWGKVKITSKTDSSKTRLGGDAKKIKQEGEAEQGRIKPEDGGGRGGDAIKIKTEEEDQEPHSGLSVSNLSDTPAQYPTRRGRPPLTYPGRVSSDAGAAEVAEEEAEQAHLRRPMGVDEAADDEDEGEGDLGDGRGEEYRLEREREQEIRERGRDADRAFAFDSGIGTSMESEHAGSSGRAMTLRRRSSKGTGTGTGKR